MKTWLKVGKLVYIYIWEIKLTKNILFKNGGQNILVRTPQNANLC